MKYLNGVPVKIYSTGRIRFRALVALILLAGLSSLVPARADVILLIHGYQGNVYSWDRSGVVPILNQFGWKPAAVLLASPQGLVPVYSKYRDSDKKVITLQLNTEVRISSQANVVTATVRWILDHYPSEQVVIVGHSLGGVISRLALVRDGAPEVRALITIASPHLGTKRALEGLEIVDDPFPLDQMKKFFLGDDYDTLERSKGMLNDILPAMPGRLLYWLNHQPHPPIYYYSIVRSSVNGALGDRIVPGYSQDMANVPAVGNQSKRLIQGFNHYLSVLDGYALINILHELGY